MSALTRVQTSTVSMGRFDKVLEGEKAVKKRKKILSKEEEKEKILKVIDRIVKKKGAPVIDMNKAVGSTINKQQQRKKISKPKGGVATKGGRAPKGGGATKGGAPANKRQKKF